MSNAKLTKKEVVELFKQDVLPDVVKQYGKKDLPAKREAWNNFTDMLQKEGLITESQYDKWLGPF